MFNSCSTHWINQRLVEITPVVMEKNMELKMWKNSKRTTWKKVEGGCVTFVVESGNYPNKSSNYPNKSSNYPNKSSNYPNKSSNYPNKSSNYPNKSSNYPNKSRNYPNKSRNYPNKSSKWNPSCNLDCKENVLS